MRHALPWTGALVALACAGCVTTKEEGDLMRRDLADLRRDLRANKDLRDQREQEMQGRLGQLDEHVKHLDDRSHKGSADLGAEITGLRDDVAGLRGQLETKEYQLRERELQLGASQQQVKDLEHKVAALELRLADLEARQKAAPAPAPAAPAPPKGPAFPEERQELYDFGKKAFDNKDYGLAREAFGRFLKAFPKDKELTDNVHFWTGEAFYAEAQYDKAILSFQKVVTDFPKSEKADGALYKMGAAFTALGYDDDAKVFYEELVQKFPKSPLVKDAKVRLDDLKKKKAAKKPAGKK